MRCCRGYASRCAAARGPADPSAPGGGPPDLLPDLTGCDSFCCDLVVVVVVGGGGGGVPLPSNILSGLNEEVAATCVLPVSLAGCHITSLQNWFLLSASHLNIRLTFPLLENVARGGVR